MKSRLTAAVLITAAVLTAAMQGCTEQKYGEKAFVVITRVDSKDPEKFLLEGTVAIEAGKMTTELPGAVFIVGVSGGVTIDGSKYECGRVLVRNTKGKLVAAKPGSTLTVPDEITILGKKYHAGKARVTKDGEIAQ